MKSNSKTIKTKAILKRRKKELTSATRTKRKGNKKANPKRRGSFKICFPCKVKELSLRNRRKTASKKKKKSTVQNIKRRKKDSLYTCLYSSTQKVFKQSLSKTLYEKRGCNSFTNYPPYP